MRGGTIHLKIKGHMQNKNLKEKRKVCNFYIQNETKFNKLLNGEESWQKTTIPFNQF